LNPLLASNGRFGARGVALKSAIVGGTVLCGWLATRHRSPAPAAIANFSMAGVYGAVALHNARLKVSRTRSMGTLREKRMVVIHASSR